MRRGRRIAALGGFGLALGLVLGGAGFGDWGEMHRALTLGLARGGPSLADVRLLLGFAGAVATAALGFALLARRDAVPRRPFQAAVVPGALAFGAGWAVSGCCPALVLVQLGEGRWPALATLAGVVAGAWACRASGWRRGTGSCSGE